VIPSSRFLSAALLEPIDFDAARVVVELGPGTGAITAEILRRLRPDARLIAVERNHRFVSHLKRCEDPRLILVHGSAESLRSQLSSHGIRSREVHAIVSSLGLTAMPPKQRDSILRQARACLSPAGTMTQYQYITSFAGQGDGARLSLHKFRAGEFLQNYFQDVTVRRIYLNFPPARVFACR
jgi:phospholipid N-methyltransferase